MKVKMNGRTYDTLKAERIATYDTGLPRMDLDYIREGLYKQDGVLFLAGESGARGRYAKNEETGGKIGGEDVYILDGSRIAILGKGRGTQKEWIELSAKAIDALNEWIDVRGSQPGALFVSLPRKRPKSG